MNFYSIFKTIIRFSIFFSILLLVFFLKPTSVFAIESLLLSDDFSNDLSQWTIPLGDENNWYIDPITQDLHIYKFVPQGTTKLLKILSTQGDDWENYKIRTKIKGLEGVDQSILLRAQDFNNHYRISFRHTVPNNVSVEVAAMVNGNGTTIGNYLYPYSKSFFHNKWYDISIEIVDFHLTINVKEESESDWEKVVDMIIENEKQFFSKGRVGFGGWVGGGGIQSIHFVYDDFELTSEISPPVPYFSQQDPGWGGNIYDKALDWDTTNNPTIANYGCALSSAAMVLNSHGVNSLPDNTPLDPGSLNNWLNANNSDTWRQGNTDWAAISGMTNDFSEDQHIPKLEFQSIITNDFNEVISDISQGIPDILQIGEPSSPSDVHFVVARDASPSGQIVIWDPYDENNTVLDPAATDLQAIRRFYQSNSNFSYIVIHADQGINPILINPNNQKTGFDGNSAFYEPENSWYILQKPIYPDEVQTPSDFPPYHELAIPKPMEGSYQLALSANNSGFYEFEVHTYDHKATQKSFKKRIFISHSNPALYDLNFSQNNDENSQSLLKQVTFASLIQEINDLFRAKMIKKSWLKISLLRMTRTAQRFHNKNYNRIVKAVLFGEINLVNSQAGKTITQEAADQLTEDIKLLIDSL